MMGPGLAGLSVEVGAYINSKISSRAMPLTVQYGLSDGNAALLIITAVAADR